mmetsp:Transcript_28055/g.51094  ORF Transcript_28055/g.51094 Transcript_28055/m.51094 type:complete len:337 (-) Transcript_28055:63-1073(-)
MVCSTAGLLTLLLFGNDYLWSMSAVDALSGSTAKRNGPLDEKDERLSRWQNRWETSMLGWHRTDVNPTLLQYGHEIIPNFMVDRDSSSSTCEDGANNSDRIRSNSATTTEESDIHNNNKNKGIRVLVPLCGKTVDMAFLAQQPSVTEVVGVDGIRKALDEFASEHPEQGWTNEPHVDTTATTATTNEKDGSALFETIMGTDIRLLKGDFMELDTEVAGGRFEAVLDRASIVAIRPELREAYVATMGRLLQPGGKALIITIDKRQASNAQAMAKGPPFSVNETEIRRWYEMADWVESVTLLGEENLFETEPPERNEQFLQDGVTSMFEMVFLIQAKQ